MVIPPVKGCSGEFADAGIAEQVKPAIMYYA
jgi:hypothetical protein